MKYHESRRQEWEGEHPSIDCDKIRFRILPTPFTFEKALLVPFLPPKGCLPLLNIDSVYGRSVQIILNIDYIIIIQHH